MAKKAGGKEFRTILQKFDSSLWHYHLAVPEVVGKTFIRQDNRRVICTLNGKVSFQCALMPKGDGSFFINVNKRIRKQLGLEEGMEVIAGLRNDDSAYGLPMPEELEELMKQDGEGEKLFHALTPGKQRTLLYIIGSPKGGATRLRRAVAVINHLKNNDGKINYKALNTDIRNTL